MHLVYLQLLKIIWFLLFVIWATLCMKLWAVIFTLFFQDHSLNNAMWMFLSILKYIFDIISEKNYDNLYFH